MKLPNAHISAGFPLRSKPAEMWALGMLVLTDVLESMAYTLLKVKRIRGPS